MTIRLKSCAKLLIYSMLVLFISTNVKAQNIPTPASYFGFEPGADYEVIDYEQMEGYYRVLASSSDRIKLEVIGKTHRGRDLLLLTISSAENLKKLDYYKNISRKLAKAEGLNDQQAQKLAKEGKAVIWIDSGLHSNELAHGQHNPNFVYEMLTNETDEVKAMREDAILLNMPMMNPDGHEVVVDWYRQQKDTEFALTDPPTVYHEYIGHDNNRDWYMMLQNETQAVAQTIYNEWYPQIVVNHHQMGEMSPRMFIPPFADPVNPNIPAMAVRGTNLVGEHMANRFAAEGKSGVIQGLTFNMWWNGGMRTVPYFHNMVGILTESTHRSPIPKEWTTDDIPDVLTRGSNEFSMKEPSIFYPDPWMGGTASLKQMVDYHLTASLGAMDIAVKRKYDWLYNIYQMGRNSIKKEDANSPKAYLISPDQWDPAEAIKLVETLRKGGVDIHRANRNFTAENQSFSKGTYIIYTAQAFRPYLTDLMEKQEYPDRRLYPDGPPEAPYDMAGWTLPLQMGVNVEKVYDSFKAKTSKVDVIEAFDYGIKVEKKDGYVIAPNSNRSFEIVFNLLKKGHDISRMGEPITIKGQSVASGSYYVAYKNASTTDILNDGVKKYGVHVYNVAKMPESKKQALKLPKIAMYQSWTAPMDEGWTRWIFDNYGIDYTTLYDKDIRQGNLSSYDIIILPSMSSSRILKGNEIGTMPTEYVGGVGVEGAYKLKKYVKNGGTILAWEGATNFVIDQFGLPIKNSLSSLSQQQFFIPGSIIKLKTDNSNPHAYGLEDDHAGFFLRESVAYTINKPAVVGDKKADMPDVKAYSWYGNKDVLLSGWALGEEQHLAGKVAALSTNLGAGEVVLIGFRPQLRAQSRATFKFVFNPILNSSIKK